MNATDKLLEIKKQIKSLQEEFCSLLSEEWERRYKDRCPNNYIPFEKFIRELSFWNRNGQNCDIIDQFENECKYDTFDPTIPRVLQIAGKYGLTHFSTVAPMICEACACEHCPYLEEHLGYTCKDCKKDGYQKYNGYCDE